MVSYRIDSAPEPIIAEDVDDVTIQRLPAIKHQASITGDKRRPSRLNLPHFNANSTWLNIASDN